MLHKHSEVGNDHNGIEWSQHMSINVLLHTSVPYMLLDRMEGSIPVMTPRVPHALLNQRSLYHDHQEMSTGAHTRSQMPSSIR